MSTRSHGFLIINEEEGRSSLAYLTDLVCDIYIDFE